MLPCILSYSQLPKKNIDIPVNLLYSLYMTSGEMIIAIMSSNRLGIRYSKKQVAAIISGCTGRRVPQCYITRWLRNEISVRNHNSLKTVWEELCVQ